MSSQNSHSNDLGLLSQSYLGLIALLEDTMIIAPGSVLKGIESATLKHWALTNTPQYFMNVAAVEASGTIYDDVKKSLLR